MQSEISVTALKLKQSSPTVPAVKEGLLTTNQDTAMSVRMQKEPGLFTKLEIKDSKVNVTVK